jgi:hypothetical protein
MTTDAYPDHKTRTTTTDYTYEFVARTSLAAGFFSPDAVRDVATTPIDDLQAARASGLQPYWLGASYAGAQPSRYTGWTPAQDGSPAVLRVPYAPSGDGMVPVPCVSIDEFRREDWETLPRRRGIEADAVKATFSIGDGTATLYEGGPGAPPRAPDVAGAPTPPPLPSVPDDSGASHVAIALLPKTAVVIEANCGPPGTNAFRAPAGFEGLVRALVPFTE